MQLNHASVKITDTLRAGASHAGVASHEIAGVRVIDCGVSEGGSNEAGLAMARAAMGGLGDVQLVTSKFPAQRFELTASKEGFELKKLHRYAGTGEIVSQSLFITRYVIGDEPMELGCGDQADNFAPHAAEKLVRHLEE